MIGRVPTTDGFTWGATSTATGLGLSATHRLGAVAAQATLRWRAVAPREHRVTLEGSVAAPFRRRGLGGALLKWAEAEARVRFAAEIVEGDVVAFCVDTTRADGGSEALFVSRGLVLAVAEDEMARPLPGPSVVPLPNDMRVATWNDGVAHLFFEVYLDAFRERPGFPGWDEGRWGAAFVNSPAFRPGLSFVVEDAREAVGYAVCWVEQATGWIVQMGVRPRSRGKGLGELILARAMDNFAALGLEEVALEVATNNPAARRLYERLGFQVRTSRQSWRKELR